MSSSNKTPSSGSKTFHIGTAGWSIPRDFAAAFAAEGSGLVRYGEVLGCAEINSTFYRSHRASTYARWAASVTEQFRFSVKVPKTITHECALAPAPALMTNFIEEVSQLASRLGPILFQLPPRQAFDRKLANDFFAMFRKQYAQGPAVLEPRHASWYSDEARAVLEAFHISRVIADPAIKVKGAAEDQGAAETKGAAGDQGGDSSLVYFRLHGSPRTYYSPYSDEWLETLAAKLSAQGLQREIWCIFDNTASGAAMGNALELTRLMKAGRSTPAL